MTAAYQVVDIEKWERKMHYQIFKDVLQPCFSVCLELDITKFHQHIKEKHYPFSLAFMYVVTKCANEIDNYRYRFLDDEVVLYERIHTSFTYMQPNKELFSVINVDMQDSMEAYIQAAQQQIASQDVYFTGPPPNDTYQFSSLPWISFTHISHTMSGNPKKANPMFDYGKFYAKEGKLFLPFSVQVHHSFVDGMHVGLLVEKLQNALNAY